jgi:hypothetical protein
VSGGSHNYVCYNIENELCGQMHDRELDDLMKDIAELAHDLEWYDSSDIGRADYMETVKKFKDKWFNGNRKERLKGYVDESINNLKSELYALIARGDE